MTTLLPTFFVCIFLTYAHLAIIEEESYGRVPKQISLIRNESCAGPEFVPG